MERYLPRIFLLLVIVVMLSLIPAAAAQAPQSTITCCDASESIRLDSTCISRENKTATLTVEVTNGGDQGTSVVYICGVFTKGSGTMVPSCRLLYLDPHESEEFTVLVTVASNYPSDIQIQWTIMAESCRPDHNVGKQEKVDLRWCPPTAVTLAGFSLSPGKGGIVVAWETASEVNNLGFNLYRGEGDVVEAAVKINSALIPSQSAGGIAGASYSYLDRGAKPGVVYHYWLEDVEAAQSAVPMGVHDLGTGQWNKPVALYVSPNSGGQVYSTAAKFNAVFRDRDGDLGVVYLLIADSANPAAGVQVRYDCQSHKFSLNNQTYATLQSGTAQVLEDGKLKITVVLAFKASFVGTHNLYIRAEDAAGNKTGWKLVGTWTVQ